MTSFLYSMYSCFCTFWTGNNWHSQSVPNKPLWLYIPSWSQSMFHCIRQTPTLNYMWRVSEYFQHFWFPIPWQWCYQIVGKAAADLTIINMGIGLPNKIQNYKLYTLYLVILITMCFHAGSTLYRTTCIVAFQNLPTSPLLMRWTLV